MIINPANLNFAFYGMKTLFQQVMEETPTHWQDIATEIKSETEEEFYAWLKRIPELREFIGERRINNLSANVQRLKNKTFEDTFGVPRAKFEDDKYGIYTNQAVRELALATRIWPDQLVAAAMIAGTTALAHDGQAFFSATHPINPDDASSATQANLQAAKALNFENLRLVVAAGRNFKAENGVPLELKFDTIIVPPALETVAEQICNTEKIAPGVNFGAGSAYTQDNPFYKKMSYKVFPRLSSDSDTTWYLTCTNRAVKPFIFQNRVAPEFAWLNKPDDENVFLRDEFLYGVRARGAAGYGPYWLAIKCTA
jgi:phage major head subunit gpT-like protein